LDDEPVNRDKYGRAVAEGMGAAAVLYNLTDQNEYIK